MAGKRGKSNMRIPPTPEPGDWQTDENGRRYRRVGNTKEYEMEINGVPQSVFIASKKAQAEYDKARYAEEQRAAKERAAQRRHCPFMSGMSADCKRNECALFVDGCTLARHTPVRDTAGRYCPFNGRYSTCRIDCALYKGGCTLTGITNTIERTK